MSQGKEPSGGKRIVSFLCDYLGISRQGYYKHVDRWLETDVLRSSIVLYAMDILKDIPKAGMRELYELCRLKFGLKFTIGRDQCYGIFRSNGLCQRNRKRPRTTYSNHNYFIYGDLLNTTPKLRPHRLRRTVRGRHHLRGYKYGMGLPLSCHGCGIKGYRRMEPPSYAG